MCLWVKLPNVSIYTPIEIIKAKAQLCIKKGGNIQYFLLLRILYCTIKYFLQSFVLHCEITAGPYFPSINNNSSSESLRP